jgi:hypothetical protein
LISAVTGVATPLAQSRVPHVPQEATCRAKPLGRAVVVNFGGVFPIEVMYSASIVVKHA